MQTLWLPVPSSGSILELRHAEKELAIFTIALPENRAALHDID
jgi:hypothetical protein